MKSTSPLIELAERVEKLTGPCRETDLAIMQAISGHPWCWADSRTFEPQTVITWDEYGADAPGNPFYTLEEFTASLDAAMTLRPEGCYVDTQERYGVHRDLEYTDHSWARVESADGGKFLGSATAKTVPLAITAASLRARASMENGNG